MMTEKESLAVWICFFFVMDETAEFLRVCETGDLERVKQLLGEGVEINTQNHVCIFNKIVF
jgi:hypothetical protein